MSEWRGKPCVQDSISDPAGSLSLHGEQLNKNSHDGSEPKWFPALSRYHRQPVCYLAPQPVNDTGLAQTHCMMGNRRRRYLLGTSEVHLPVWAASGLTVSRVLQRERERVRTHTHTHTHRARENHRERHGQRETGHSHTVIATRRARVRKRAREKPVQNINLFGR